MAVIPDRDASIFKEASIPAIQNLNAQELDRIAKLAQELKAILDGAKKRQQDSLLGRK